MLFFPDLNTLMPCLIFFLFYRVKKMGSCDFCKAEPKEKLKSCVCGKASYCSKECQVKDWKVHKPSCPPFIVRESPGKGRGMFASRKIKEGQIILDEYPLLTVRRPANLPKFRDNHYPSIDEETKEKILKLNDPAENLKTLDLESVKVLIMKNPALLTRLEAKTDEISKIFRIFCGNNAGITEDEAGLYNLLSHFNHSCAPNATHSWVKGDFHRKQVKAIKTIEKDEEILISYKWGHAEFNLGSREFRRQQLLEIFGFLCKCSECSLEGEDLEDNERMRAEIVEKDQEIEYLVRHQGSEPIPRKSMKKVMKLAQERLKLVQKLDIRTEFLAAMVNFYHFAVRARRMDITCQNDPDIFKQEALKYAKMFGDSSIHCYNIAMGN